MNLTAANKTFANNSTAQLVDVDGSVCIRRKVGNEFVCREVPARTLKALLARGHKVVRLPRTYETFGAVSR